MRRGGWALALAALLCGAPAVGAAQPGPAHRGGPAEMADRAHERRPFQRLLRHRDELGLTDAQVARLGEISRGLEAANAPLRARLRGEAERFLAERRARMERLTPEQRRDTLRRLRAERRRPPLPPAMRALMAEMRGNIARATREAQDVLTPEQKRRARALMREHRREMRGRGMGPGAHPPRPAPPGRP